MKFKIYTEEEKEQLRKLSKVVCKTVSVAEIADNLYGLTLYQSKSQKKYLKCYEHPSLVIDVQKNIAYFNTQRPTAGLSGYDFVAFYEGSSYLQARKKLNEYYCKRDPRNLELYHYDYQKDDVIKHKGIYLPKMNESNQNVIQFLMDKGISERTIQYLLDESIIYEDEKNNMVVIGYDPISNLPVNGIKIGEKEYLSECYGSFSQAGILLEDLSSKNDLKTMKVFIDVLDMIKEFDKNPANTILYLKDISELSNTLLLYQSYLIENEINSIEFFVNQNTSQFEEINSLIDELKEHHYLCLAKGIKFNVVNNVVNFEYESKKRKLTDIIDRETLEKAKQVARRKMEEIEEKKLLQQQEEMSL